MACERHHAHLMQGHNDAWEAQFRETDSMKLSTSGVSLSNNTAVVRPSTSGVSLSNSAAAVRPENSTSLPGTPQRSLSNTSPVPSSGGPPSPYVLTS